MDSLNEHIDISIDILNCLTDEEFQQMIDLSSKDDLYNIVEPLPEYTAEEVAEMLDD